MTEPEIQIWRFSRVARFLNQAIRRYRMRSRQKDLILYVIDMTWGEFRDTAPISAKDLAAEFGWDASDARKELKELVTKNVLKDFKTTGWREKVYYQVNSKVESWDFEHVNDRPQRPIGKMPLTKYWDISEPPSRARNGGDVHPSTTPEMGGTYIPASEAMEGRASPLWRDVHPSNGGTPDPPITAANLDAPTVCAPYIVLRDLRDPPPTSSTAEILSDPEPVQDDEEAKMTALLAAFDRLTQAIFVNGLCDTDKKRVREFLRQHRDRIPLAKDAYRLGCQRVKAEDRANMRIGKETWNMKIQTAIRYANEHISQQDDIQETA